MVSDDSCEAKDPYTALGIQRTHHVKLAAVKLEQVFPEKTVVDVYKLEQEMFEAVGDVLDKHLLDTDEADVHSQRIIAHEIRKDNRWLLVDFMYILCNYTDYEYHTAIPYTEDDTHKCFYYKQSQKEQPDVIQVVERFCALAPANLKVGISAALEGASPSQTPCSCPAELG